MARFRLSRPAQVDLALILSISEERWGQEGRRRYAAKLAAAIRQVAADPQGPLTRDRSTLLKGLRSLHIRHAGADDPGGKVKRPVHILYYRAAALGLIEIVRILHERSEPSRHVQAKSKR